MLLSLHEEQETVQILGQPVIGELCLLALCHKDTAALHNLYNKNHRGGACGNTQDISNSSDY